uniref:Mucin-like peritrophin n=1 Tax=Toxorhynchites amboinensis TaxID=46208 RepID=A0FIU9_TOXAM|nr:mucin-like peritrophin [Toxorhynchites amboinensis]
MFCLIVILGVITGGFALVLCPPNFDPAVTIHIPHPTNCSKFITCVGSQPVEQDCPQGLEWSESATRCDYQQNANCEHRVRVRRSENATVETTTVSASKVENTTHSGGSIRIISSLAILIVTITVSVL